MKTLKLAIAFAVASAAPSFAETSIAELFAMSNQSAAETLVRETSMGDVTTARVQLALSNMSAAERETFPSSLVTATAPPKWPLRPKPSPKPTKS